MIVFTIANFKTHSTREITTKFLSRDKVEHARPFPTSMEMCMDNHLTLTTEKIQQKQFQDKNSEQSCSTHSISPDSQKNTVHSHAELPPGMENIPRETIPARKRENHGYGYIYIRNHHSDLSEQVLCTQHTYISGELQEDANLQHEGTSILQCQC